MDGAILVVSALDGPMPADPGPPVRLVARGAQARASCANANGTGQSGLVRVAVNFVDSRTGEQVPVVLETLPGQDIDASGRYDVFFQVGEERAQRVIRARLRTERRTRGGRHGR
jgi:hypothetical protein